MTRDFQRAGLRVSLVLHGIALVLMLVLPWIFRACERRRPNEKLMFVEFTVSVPPPPAPETPTPEPPKPEPTDDVPMPDQKVEKKPAPPKPPKDIRQTNRVARKDFPKAPPPKDKPPSAAEIARLLKMGASLGDTTSIPADAGQLALGAYFNHVHERMYAVWQQPAQLKSLPGLSTEIRITVAPDGRIVSRAKTRGSGNDLMDDSVMKAVNAVKALRALPVGHREPVDIAVVFEIGD